MPLSRAIGLIAGNGFFPLMFARSAKAKGFSVFAVCVKTDTNPKLKSIVDEITWVNVGEFKKMVEFFKAKGLTSAVMAGQITPKKLFDKRIKWDSELENLLANISNKKADTIFSAIANLLKKYSIELIDSTSFLSEEELPKKGTLTFRSLTEKELADINFGFDIAKKVADLDIGQTVVIKDKCIVAVEAFEGTNSAILRAGRLVGPGTVIVKVSRPKQDMRFDVPVIGPKTIMLMKKVGASAIGIEAGKTVVVQRKETITFADKSRIAIYAV
ncbi:MAG: UDP-2,3-diacylglucosamine diphosphatase LpxI [Candidatus Omnitrophota bacterium]